MKRIAIGAAVGTAAGILDVLPMIVQKLPWEANLSAFSMWLIIGVFIATTEYRMRSGLKGVIIAFLVLLPSAVLIGSQEPFSLLPISIMTIILGAGSGILVELLKRRLCR